MSNSAAALIQTLVRVLNDLETARYMSAAAVTLYLYDILITIDLEVRTNVPRTLLIIDIREFVNHPSADGADLVPPQFQPSDTPLYDKSISVSRIFSCPHIQYVARPSPQYQLPTVPLLSPDVAGFHGVFSDEYCRSPVFLVGVLLSYISWATIMTLRVWALFRQRRIIARFIWFCWLCAMGAIVITAYLSYRKLLCEFEGNVPRHTLDTHDW
jgi:hypothetical protein